MTRLPLLIALLVLPSLARAQSEEAPPATIHAPPPGAPVEPLAATPAPPTPAPTPPVTAPIPNPQLPQVNFELQRKYNQEHLQIRGARRVEVYPGVRWHGAWGMGWGYGGPRWGVAVVPGPTAVVVAGSPWGVYRNGDRLSVPDFLTVVGDTERSEALQADIRRSNNWSKVWTGTTGASAIVTAVGFIGMVNARDRWDYRTNESIASLGVLGIVGSLVGRSVCQAEASDLRYDYRESLSFPEAEDRVTRYNGDLRGSLGMRAEDAPPDVVHEPGVPQ